MHIGVEIQFCRCFAERPGHNAVERVVISVCAGRASRRVPRFRRVMRPTMLEQKIYFSSIHCAIIPYAYLQPENFMRSLLIPILCLAATACTTTGATKTPSTTPIAKPLTDMGTVSTVPWLPGATVTRFEDADFGTEDTPMAVIRREFEAQCKTSGGKIHQPRQHNCWPMRSTMGCAVGELQINGLGSEFELGLKDAARASGDRVQVMWEGADITVSKKLLYNIFFNKGGREIAIVGGLQRCQDADGKLLKALAFASINGNKDVITMTPEAYANIVARGAQFVKARAEAKQAQTAAKEASEAAAQASWAASLKTGDVVRHAKTRDKGMVIEIKPPLAQIQWDERYGGKRLEWTKTEELIPAKQ